MSRNYKGHEIVRQENGQMNCAGNPWPGCRTYFEVYRNGKMIFATATLKRAKMMIDGPQIAPENAAKVRAALAALAADVKREMAAHA